jgi:hypothetical protein
VGFDQGVAIGYPFSNHDSMLLAGRQHIHAPETIIGYDKAMFGSNVPWEIVLLAVLVLAFAFVVRAVRRRKPVAVLTAAEIETATALPRLETQQRVAGAVKRVFRDPGQGLWLATIKIGPSRFTFCPTDWAENRQRYEALAADPKSPPADLALFALCTLAPGGAEGDARSNQGRGQGRPDIRDRDFGPGRRVPERLRGDWQGALVTNRCLG